MTSRLDSMVASRLGVSRTQAAALIMAGDITVDGKPGRKPGQAIADDATVERTGQTPDVSRAGGKLRDALATWQVPVSGSVCLDVGASTGGFTEALLHAGATKVIAIDVGRGQLAWKLRKDPRVINLERTDIRTMSSLPEPVDLTVVDVSFISLRLVVPALEKLLSGQQPVIALFKPQFEAGRKTVSQGKGIIRDEALIDQLAADFRHWVADRRWSFEAELPSTVAGAKGNRERLLRLATPAVD